MIIVVDTNGIPHPADAIKFPAAVPVKDMGEGRVLISNVTEAAHEKTVTREVVEGSITKWTGTRTFTATQSRTFTVTSTPTVTREVTAVTVSHTRTREVTRTVTHAQGTLTVSVQSCADFVTAGSRTVTKDWTKDYTRSVTEATLSHTREIATRTVTADVTVTRTVTA